jgi:hypothetical protein
MLSVFSSLFFIGDKIQTVLKTPQHLKPNKNKTFPIGTIQTVKHIFEELHLTPLLDSLEHCGHSLIGLTTSLVSYKMTEDLSVSRCHNGWPTIPCFYNIYNSLLLETMHSTAV